MTKSISNFKFLLLFVLFAGIMSCAKDDKNTEESDFDNITIANIDMSDMVEDIADLDLSTDISAHPQGFPRDCFTPVFPLTIEFPDGSTQEVADKDAMKTILQEWRENHNMGDGHPTIQFPFDATLADGSTTTFNDRLEVRAVLKTCVGDRPPRGKHKKCFQPVFPVTIVFPDGSVQEIPDQETMKSAIMEWRLNNPDVDGRPTFQFPIDITLKDGTVTTVVSKENLLEIIKDCKVDRKKRPHFGKCFKIVYPFSLEMPDGTIVTANSREELRTMLMEWRENNPDVDGRPALVFPFEVEIKNGDIITINNKEEFIKLLRKCKRKKGGHGPN